MLNPIISASMMVKLILRIGILKGRMLMMKCPKLPLCFPYSLMLKKMVWKQRRLNLKEIGYTWIISFVKNLLYEVGCRLIDEIADQVINEDDNGDVT